MSTTEDTSPPGLINDASSIRRKHPCILCQQRKVKCDRDDPCANCRKARVECLSSSMQPPKRRKKRFPEAELLARIKRYEAHLRGYGADLDAINREEAPLPEPSLKPDVIPSSTHFKIKMEELEDGYRSMSVRESLKHMDNNLSKSPLDEFQQADEFLEGSSDEETFDGAITKTYDEIALDSSELLFNSTSTEDISVLHPQPVHIFRLWQIFLDNVNPVFKLFHAPSVQQRILDASADLQNASKSMHVLMFGIYTMSVLSLTDEDCMSYFNESKEKLSNAYSNGAKLALVQSKFMRNSDMTTLQGLMLYLFSCLNQLVDPRALFCLTGIAVRIAQRMGCNFDGTGYGLPPFETEMRRRLWWQIVFLDYRVGELAGCPPSMVQHLRTCKLPLNVNDSDLFPDMREPPIEHTGVTEMLHVLPRCEIIKLYLDAKVHSVPPRSRISDSQIDEFEALIEEKYLKWCDDSVPWQVLAKLSAQMAIAKVRLGNFKDYVLGNQALPAGMDVDLKEKMVAHCLVMQENFFKMASNKTLERFHWHVYKNFPFPALIFILSALRMGVSKELEDRAWAQIKLSSAAMQERWKEQLQKTENHPLQPANFHSALNVAISSLTCKAWDATSSRRPDLQTPAFITIMRERLAIRKAIVKAERGNISPSPEISPEQSSISQSTNEDVLVGEYNNLGNQYSWMSQPGMMNTDQYDLEMNTGGDGMGGMDGGMMGSNDMAMMGQDTNWSMWDDFMQPGVPTLDTGNGEQKFYG